MRACGQETGEKRVMVCWLSRDQQGDDFHTAIVFPAQIPPAGAEQWINDAGGDFTGVCLTD
jgi:hypothetical protein